MTHLISLNLHFLIYKVRRIIRVLLRWSLKCLNEIMHLKAEPGTWQMSLLLQFLSFIDSTSLKPEQILTHLILSFQTFW